MTTVLFEGCTFTTTDISTHEKSKIAEMISYMGGKLHNNLTSDTNILIVGSTDTAKSKFCLEHRTDVTLIYPNDFYDIYRRFKEKTVPNINISILDEYPWPIFDNCLLCVSRLRDVESPCFEKHYINKLIQRFGGTSTSTLTPKVTFLITDKREGVRYERALEWNIVPVHPKWVIDSCNCQRILNPKLYDISKIDDVRDIGRGAFIKHRRVVEYGKTANNPVYEEMCKDGTRATIVEKPMGLFAGFIFSCYGFNETQVGKLSNVLKTNGGEIQDEHDLSVTHVIVPSSMTLDEVPEKIQRLKNISDSRIVNEWFVERSLFYNKIMHDSWSLPPPKLDLNYEFKIHYTGFCEIESFHLSKLISNLNLTLSSELTDSCDFLITNLSSLGLTPENSPQLFKYKHDDILYGKSTSMSATSVSLTKKKINSAKKWNIPVVSIAFIWELSQTGVLPSVLDTQWCIFAPKNMRPATNFLEYARSISGGAFHTQRPEGSPISSPTKLPVPIPSPRKNSQKKWPKLVGTASDSQLRSNSAVNFDDEYEYKSARRLNFDEDHNQRQHNSRGESRRKLAELVDDFGFDDMPVFKKRR